MTLELAKHPAEVLALFKDADFKSQAKHLWSVTYPADPVLEPDLIGLTYGQAITYTQMRKAACGNDAAVDRVLDRLYGKAVQTNTNVNVNASYKDFLDEVAKQEGISKENPDGVTDAEFVPSRDAEEIT